MEQPHLHRPEPHRPTQLRMTTFQCIYISLCHLLNRHINCKIK